MSGYWPTWVKLEVKGFNCMPTWTVKQEGSQAPIEDGWVYGNASAFAVKPEFWSNPEIMLKCLVDDGDGCGNIEAREAQDKRRSFEEAANIYDQLVEWRRGFHVFPELAFEERVTSSRVFQILKSMPGVEVTQAFGETTAVIGKISGKREGRAIMIRCPMDALPLQEETDLTFASCIPGVMHGCGHDAHMAVLLGVALLLSQRREMLDRSVVLVFQPAEEGLGGAKRLIDAGLLDSYNIGYALGFHFWPKYGYGKLLLRPGIMTALSDRFHISIQGVGGHAAAPHLTVDPWTIIAHVILAAQALVGREIDPTESAVISFGHLEAGEAHNVIPEQIDLWGSLRALNVEVRDFLQNRLEEVVPLLAKTFRGLVLLNIIVTTPR